MISLILSLTSVANPEFSWKGCANSQIPIFTGRNEVVAKVMFLQVCVCPQGGRVSASVHGGMPYPPGMENHPPPDGEPPQDRDTPPPEADSSIWSMSGRYTSYWNAFLWFIYCAENCMKMKEFGLGGIPGPPLRSANAHGRRGFCFRVCVARSKTSMNGLRWFFTTYTLKVYQHSFGENNVLRYLWRFQRHSPRD